MIDFHTVHVISNGIKYYKETQSAFIELFEDVSEAYAIKLHDKLQSIDVSFNTSYNKKFDNYPLITTSVDEQSDDTDNQLLANRGISQGKVMFFTQKCVLNIYTADIDIMRVLHRLVQASMLLFKQDLLNVGYLNIEFKGSSDLKPDPDLVGKDVLVYRKELRYNGQRQLITKPVDGTITNVSWDLSPTIIDTSNI